ncbi:hypothetical protein evm_005191 [Chilo suppressalis]|nr:hypothetical protein evm_005191 [Chilo suppressalis]
MKRLHPHVFEKEQLRLPPSHIDKSSNKEEVYILEYIKDESILDEIDYITTDDKNEPQKVTSKDADTEDEDSLSKNDSDNCNTEANDDQEAIAILVSKTTPRRWSWVKKYMRSIDERSKECLLCSNVLRLAPGSYSNMTRHIKNKHLNVYNKEYRIANMPRKKSQEKTSDDTENQTEKSNISKSLLTAQEDDSEGDGSPDKYDSDDFDTKANDDPEATADLFPKMCSNKWSWVRKYMRNINDRCKQCRICSSVLRLASGSNKDMIRHIRAKHANIFEKEFVANWSNKKRQKKQSDDTESQKEKINISSKEDENEDDDKDLSDSRNETEESTKCEDVQEIIEITTNSKMYIQPYSGIPMRYCWVKDYSKKLDDEKWQCSLCLTELRMRPGYYGNMKRHIRNKHPNIYQKELLHFVSESDAVKTILED